LISGGWKQCFQRHEKGRCRIADRPFFLLQSAMSKTILIVEDEQAIADGITYALRTDGYVPQHVTLAASCCT
jgi:hypothetical protein